jgi:DNA-binding NarL/FixJ family response regulator
MTAVTLRSGLPRRETAGMRVLLVDDDDAFRDGMAALLGLAGDLEVIGQAADGDEGVRLTQRLQPDVVLMDLEMPGRGGIEATRAIAAGHPHIAVLVLTLHEDDASVLAAMRAGARGYIVKGTRREGLLRAIRTVADGGAVFGPAVARRMIDYLSSAAAAPPFGELTERERQILELIARGRSNAQIAEQLVLSRGTVRNHVSNVFAKLRVDDRAQAIVKAREAGMR